MSLGNEHAGAACADLKRLSLTMNGLQLPKHVCVSLAALLRGTSCAVPTLYRNGKFRDPHWRESNTGPAKRDYDSGFECPTFRKPKHARCLVRLDLIDVTGAKTRLLWRRWARHEIHIPITKRNSHTKLQLTRHLGPSGIYWTGAVPPLQLVYVAACQK